MFEREIAEAMAKWLKDCAPADWLAYEAPEMQEKEACTVGHFGDWIVGSESNHPGGNYRDDDCGSDEAHAKFIALVKNHAPQIIAALNGFSETQNALVAATGSVAQLLMVHEERDPDTAATLAQQIVAAAYKDQAEAPK